MARRLIEVEVDEGDIPKLSRAALATVLDGAGEYLAEVRVCAVLEFQTAGDPPQFDKDR